MSAIVQDVIELLLTSRTALGLPAVSMDFLPETGDALSVQAQDPKVFKTFIDGTKFYRFVFVLMARTDNTARLSAFTWLEACGALFSGMDNFAISSTRHVIDGESNTPSIISQTESRITYGMTVTIKYMEA